MNTKLILEITRNKELMGLLVEQNSPAVEIADDVVKILVSKFKNLDSALISDIGIVKSLAKNRNPQKQKILINAINRLLENKKIADYLIPKLYQSLDNSVKSWVNSAKQQIKNAKKNGKTYNDVLNGINTATSPRTISQSTNRPVVDVEIPKLREYLRWDLQNYAYEVFNPLETKYTKAIEKGIEQAKSGFVTGLKSKSGGLIATKIFLKKITRNKIEKMAPRFFKPLTPEDKVAFWGWFATGIPDSKTIWEALIKVKLVHLFANITAQSLKKSIFLMFVLTTYNIMRDLFVDAFFRKGEEYSDTWGWITLYRIARAFEFPLWGIVNPVLWVIKLIFIAYVNGGASGSGEGYKAVWEYLTGDNIDKTPNKKVIKFKEFINRTKNGLDKSINEKENQLKEALSGKDVQIKELEQSDTKIPLQEPKNTEINQQPNDTTNTQTTEPPKAEQKPNIQQPKPITRKKSKPAD